MADPHDDWAEQESARAAAMNAARRASGFESYELTRGDVVNLCLGARVPGGRRAYAKLTTYDLWRLYLQHVGKEW